MPVYPVIHHRIIHLLTISVLAISAVFLAGCSDSNPSGLPDDNSSNSVPSDGLTSVFDESDAVNERFGTVTSRNTNPDVDSASQAMVVRAINEFSLDLHRIVANGEPDGGSVESGYSAAVALSLAYAGTSGETQVALANMLGVDDISEPLLHIGMNTLDLALTSRSNEDLVLHTANRVFVRPDFTLQNSYLDIATGDYGAPVTEADFAGATDEVTRLVNDWVAEQTDNFIPSIINRFSPQTVFALLNTIFLDAGWQDQYESIGERPFNAIDGTTAMVESFSGRSDIPLLRSDNLTALEIPYGGGDIAMLLLMPTAISDFESTLNENTLDSKVNAMTNSDVTFVVPNWEDEADLDLASILAPLGFPTNPWDFGRMFEGGEFLEVIAKQKARIEVDENGTRAAAVTIVAGIESVSEFVTIDQPFVYVIRDRVTGLVLFSGRVVSPG